ncbi:DUF4249 domain-containing protein [Flagellimonas meishanensis]|uniref:DUF4249 domain-containing protein n=1 Tax=Flagellimonas meishanensis TaxID=2873264 RepID=UPI001CA78C13|nr:DUF4249 domain-containing protein [[Muricauda] meishanensis]
MTWEKVTYRFFSPIFMGGLLYGCIEPFEATFEDFESALVVEATITNELKNQEVFLSRTFEFEADGPTAESNANVLVEDQSGNTFTFRDMGNGNYVSAVPFAAETGNTYRLSITTQDGRSYASQSVALNTETNIDELRAERTQNGFGEDGIAILLDTNDSQNQSKYYRFTYGETFRIEAPLWSPNSLAADTDPEAVPCGVKVLQQTRNISESICYASVASNGIILANTEGFSEDRLDDFRVRFINRDNYFISHRYSILVKQFVLSNEAYTFYETLQEFSGSESLFSETQPGFLVGNVSSETNQEEKVLGYFDVSPVAEQRIFFNYEDFYPNENLPPYIEPCNLAAPVLSRGVPPVCVLLNLVESELVAYVEENQSGGPNEGPYIVVPKVCGDCTSIGSSTPPEFWME